jgi:hypothetical protein
MIGARRSSDKEQDLRKASWKARSEALMENNKKEPTTAPADLTEEQKRRSKNSSNRKKA